MPLLPEFQREPIRLKPLVASRLVQQVTVTPCGNFDCVVKVFASLLKPICIGCHNAGADRLGYAGLIEVEQCSQFSLAEVLFLNELEKIQGYYAPLKLSFYVVESRGRLTLGGDWSTRNLWKFNNLGAVPIFGHRRFMLLP